MKGLDFFTASSVDLLGTADAKELRHQFLHCQLFICPVRNTFGMKFKLAEALSYGTPFLASPETLQCVPHLSGIPTLPLDDAMQAAKNIAAVIANEKTTADLAQHINAQQLQFISTQTNIWSRTLK